MKNQRVIIVGGGTLAAQVSKMTAVEMVERHQFDFCKDDIAVLAQRVLTYDVIVITAGTIHGSANDIFSTNFLKPIQLLETLTALDYSGRVILVGSHGATWPSWPGIDLSRLNYNFSKRFLREFVKGLSHSGQSKIKFTVFEPTKFPSKMSGFQGIDIQLVAQSLIDVIHGSDHLLHVELN